jgi:hypothetical protein
MKQLTHLKPNHSYKPINGKMIPIIQLDCAVLSEYVEHTTNGLSTISSSTIEEYRLNYQQLTEITKALLELHGTINKELAEFDATVKSEEPK